MTKQGAHHVARAALLRWTRAAVASDAAAWLDEAMASIDGVRLAELNFGLAPRRVGRDPLALTPALQAEAVAMIPGWQPHTWRIDEAVRILIAAERAERDSSALDRLVRHADVAELCALYRGLPLYAPMLELDDLIGRGLRTHVTPVFEAIAHANPYPAARFDEHRWNHLVLKALFMEVPLAPVLDFDARRNPALERMALDFAAERAAAGRPIPDDLWRCVSHDAAALFTQHHPGQTKAA